MDQTEQRMFSDVVKLVNRIPTPLTFVYDSFDYTLEGHGSKMLPRHIAVFGVNRHPVKVSHQTGRVMVSLLGIEGMDRYPTTPLDGVDLEDLATASKLDVRPGVVNGKPVVMKAVALPATEESYAGHNL